MVSLVGLVWWAAIDLLIAIIWWWLWKFFVHYVYCLVQFSQSLVDVHNSSPSFHSLPPTIHGPCSRLSFISKNDLWKMYIRVDFPAAENLPVTSHQYWNEVLRSCCSSQSLWHLSACPAEPYSCASASSSLSFGHVDVKPGKLIPITESLQRLFPMAGVPFPSPYTTTSCCLKKTARIHLPFPFTGRLDFPLWRNYQVAFLQEDNWNEKLSGLDWCPSWWREMGWVWKTGVPSVPRETGGSYSWEDHFLTLGVSFAICRRAT